MKSQRSMFKWFTVIMAFVMLFESALALPSVSAQGENTPTPTATSTATTMGGGLTVTALSQSNGSENDGDGVVLGLNGGSSPGVGGTATDIYAWYHFDLQTHSVWSPGQPYTYLHLTVKNNTSATQTIYASWELTSSLPAGKQRGVLQFPNYPITWYDLPYTGNDEWITEIGPNQSLTFTTHIDAVWPSSAADVGRDVPYTNDHRLHLTVYPGSSGVSTPTPQPTYDCSGTTLSSIAQAVLAEVGEEQEYCGNDYNSIITLPPGQAAFERFGDLAATAEYEVDFVTMGWDPDRDPNNTDSPGDYMIDGIRALYERVQATQGSHLVRVRILLGLPFYFKSFDDQKLIVLNDLADLEIPTQDTNWSVVVASYRWDYFSGKHSHVKMMIVDGKYVIASGYNLHYNYLDDVPAENKFPQHDMGVEVSGPIARRSLEVFDGLWLGAEGCQRGIYDLILCNTITETPHDSAILGPNTTGNNIVFSLFRDHTDKTADNAIEAAINAAESEVNIIQNRFMDDRWYPPKYARAILNVLEKGNGQVNVNLLVSGAGHYSGHIWQINDLAINIAGICNLKDQFLDEDPIGTHNLVTKFSSNANPIHTKALSIDGTFIIVGSQNFDQSAWGNDDSLSSFGDLAEYSLGVSSIDAANDFNSKFDNEFDAQNGAHDISCVPYSMYSQSALQTAIDEASPGSALFLPGGVYKASVTINKPLLLIGAGANESIIQPQGNEPAFRVTSSDVVISNMRISGGDGYGIQLIDSSPSSLKDIQINRVVFENNTQGGVLAQGLITGSPMNYAIENSTFIGGAEGVTINMTGTQAETSTIRNNIFFGQSNAPIHVLSADDSRVEYSYNLFDDCGLGACATNWHLGDISASSSAHDNLFDSNPMFASTENGAYQLLTGSPAIDAGDPSLLHDFFYDGDNDGTVRIDLGAFEYVPVANVAPAVNAGNDQTVELASSVTINATYTDADNSENHSARIDWGDGTVEDVPVTMTGPGAGEVTGQHTYSNTGNYTVEFCITDLYGSVGCDTINVQVVSTPTNTPTSTPTFTPTPTPTNTPTNTPTSTPTNTPTNTPTPTFTPTATPTQPIQPLYLSLNNAATVGGVSAQDIDILSFNGTTWSMFFDGSDVGISTTNQDLNEFHLLDADTILMTFDEPITLGSLTADPWDVVRFDATSLGNNTAGTFSMYLDGNDVGLDTTNEYLDGLDVLPDGRVLISTTGSPTVSGVTGATDEDILAFTPTTLGDVTSGTWSMYFDGSDVGLADSSNEDVDALAVHANGDIYLSTAVDFTVTGISGLDEDVFICTPTSLGNTTACNYSPSLYFDGSAYGLDANDVDGIDLTLP